MEVKINREIRAYTESMFFGLSLRQFFFSICACGVAVALYFVIRPYFGMETVSWMCIVSVAPFAAMGFISYHGMTAEQFVWAWIKSELIMPKRLIFQPVIIYHEALKGVIEKKRLPRDWPLGKKSIRAGLFSRLRGNTQSAVCDDVKEEMKRHGH